MLKQASVESYSSMPPPLPISHSHNNSHADLPSAAPLLIHRRAKSKPDDLNPTHSRQPTSPELGINNKKNN